MPVGIKQVGNKWRVTEGNRIATNKKGTALDGGGHGTREAALQQMKAVNASLHRAGKI